MPYAVENAKKILGKKPAFGICMGHQVGMGSRRWGWPRRALPVGTAMAEGVALLGGHVRLAQLVVPCCCALKAERGAWNLGKACR